MDSTTVLDDTTYHEGGAVEAVTIRRAAGPAHPSGWVYRLHYGTVGGDRFIRYDNAHERTKGHERHTPEGVETVAFPGMFDRFDRFQREIADADW